MNYQDYISCIQNIHRDTHDLIQLNTQIHQGMLQILTNSLQPNVTQNPLTQTPPAPMPAPMPPQMRPSLRPQMSQRPIIRTPAQIVRRTSPSLNYVNLNNFLQPVEISPSSDQLDVNTTMTHYRTISNPINTSCPIRNEPFQPNDIVIQINTCGHIFFVNEFYGWFRGHVNCPLCRRDIRDTSQSPDINLLDETQPSDILDATDVAANPPNNNTPSNPFVALPDLSHNLLEHDLFNSSTFNFDLSDISLNNNFHNYMTNDELANMHNDPQVQALQTLTETIATELTNQLQNNIAHSDLSNSDIELSLSFGAH
tara:strand:- start:9928 stop:10863 length:936 start_codon:yes stop_codon:yes gene_type:complete